MDTIIERKNHYHSIMPAITQLKLKAMLEYNTVIQYKSYVSKDHVHYEIPTQPKFTRDHDEVF